jgi:hypothetical protein
MQPDQRKKLEHETSENSEEEDTPTWLRATSEKLTSTAVSAGQVPLLVSSPWDVDEAKPKAKRLPKAKSPLHT